jgi:hypothetical protein
MGRPRPPDLLDDDDDLDGGDPGEPPHVPALAPSLLDDDVLEDIDAVAREGTTPTLDEFVVPSGVFDPPPPADDLGTELDASIDEPSLLPVLPWSTVARIVDTGLDVPTVLDPTVGRSVWVTRSAAPGHQRITVRITTIEGSVTVEVRDGSPEILRLGRDWLAGRAVVGSGSER